MRGRRRSSDGASTGRGKTHILVERPKELGLRIRGKSRGDDDEFTGVGLEKGGKCFKSKRQVRESERKNAGSKQEWER